VKTKVGPETLARHQGGATPSNYAGGYENMDYILARQRQTAWTHQAFGDFQLKRSSGPWALYARANM
jgi:hypothetical protein